MLFIIIHGIINNKWGFPVLEVIDAYFIDQCNQDEREELIRMRDMIHSAGNGIRVEVHSLNNTDMHFESKFFAIFPLTSLVSFLD